MSFFHFIEKLRNKSEQDRRAISLVCASVMFSFIFFVWLTTFQLTSGRVENEEVYNELSPIASLKNMSSRFFADIKEELNFNKDDEPTEPISQLQTETTATGAAVTNIFDEEATTTKNIFFENNEEEENLFGTSSNEIQVGTSSNGIDSDAEFTEETTENEEKNSPVNGEGPN